MRAIWGVITASLVSVSGCASKPAIPDVTEDGRWLVITQSEGTNLEARVFLKDLT